MFVFVKNPIKIIQEFLVDNPKKEPPYKSCGMSSEEPPIIKCKEDMEPVQFRTKKIVYGSKDIEV